MTEYWVIGGEFNSLNFHTLDPDSKQIFGPFNTRTEAEEKWREVSEQFRYKATFRFRIVTVDN